MCVLTNFAKLNFRANRLKIVISAEITRIIFSKTANFFNFLAHLLLSYTYFFENFREKKSFRENHAPSKFVHKNVFLCFCIIFSAARPILLLFICFNSRNETILLYGTYLTIKHKFTFIHSALGMKKQNLKP
jgi:hypothetical protein